VDFFLLLKPAVRHRYLKYLTISRWGVEFGPMVIVRSRNLNRNVANRNLFGKMRADWLLDVSTNHKMSSQCFPK
jgi:hypothetical protein